MNKYGVSFSIKQCRNFGIEPEKCLDWLINEAGFRRFRLMSYWNEIEKAEGQYDFTGLDRQIQKITDCDGEISLCLGVRQPRWPENHWPNWAWALAEAKRTEAILKFIEMTVNRYKDSKHIVSYQLENEALLASFGERSDVNRERLNQEFSLVKSLDPNIPVIMTTSSSWGIPIRHPIPDIVGFSFYQIVYNKGKYSRSFHKPIVDQIRALLIKILHGKPSFIHELQLEPWGPKNIWEMPIYEQNKSMSQEQMQLNLKMANKTKLPNIDLWGGEWWYWRTITHNSPDFGTNLKQLLNKK